MNRHACSPFELLVGIVQTPEIAGASSPIGVRVSCRRARKGYGGRVPRSYLPTRLPSAWSEASSFVPSCAKVRLGERREACPSVEFTFRSQSKTQPSRDWSRSAISKRNGTDPPATSRVASQRPVVETGFVHAPVARLMARATSPPRKRPVNEVFMMPAGCQLRFYHTPRAKVLCYGSDSLEDEPMTQTFRTTLMTVTVAAVFLAHPQRAAAQPSYAPTNSEPNPFQAGVSFGQLPDGRKWGSTAGIDIAPDGTIWAYDRCGANSCVGSTVTPILHFDTTGKLLGSFGAGMFNFPHGISVDKDGNVWVSDHGVNPPNGRGQVVYKFSPEGKILLTLGKPGIAGNGPDTFNQPSDVLVASNGDIFVADGHGPQTNARIVKFDKTGKFLMTWGGHGSGESQLEGPHALAMDSQGRLFVGDRTNNRVPVFHQNGKLLASWKQL